jgi:adenylate kinase
MLQNGELLPDEVVQRLLGQLLHQQATGQQGWLLDGFPRTESQARWLDEVTSVQGALLLTLPREVLVAKLAGRRVCPDCGKTFNFMYIQQAGLDMPPLLPDSCSWAPAGLSVAVHANAPTGTPTCDCPRTEDDGTPTRCSALQRSCERGQSCLGRLRCRDDDRVEVVRHRLAVYDRIGAPVEQYYEATGRLHRFPLTGGVTAVMPALESFLRERAVALKTTSLRRPTERLEEQGRS